MRKLRLGLLVILGMGLVGTTAPRATADSNKCRPTVRVENNRPSTGRTIKVTKFLYKVAGSPEVFTESLVNKNIAPGRSADWPSQTLRFAVKGVVVDQTAVEFKDDNGPGWDPPETTGWFPHSFTCGDNHTFIQRID